ncbi:hypothetical protein TNCV_2628961 [Trichonephila clavipes]|uniref:Uncharacterized protein n=1 Tax=Trichonephila clavipes TaxID=2585209 RepID=A0A8X6SA39_TRICX|nr:hypothetical protein TNCV_2628961 [Trichonephila clavipes]
MQKRVLSVGTLTLPEDECSSECIETDEPMSVKENTNVRVEMFDEYYSEKIRSFRHFTESTEKKFEDFQPLPPRCAQMFLSQLVARSLAPLST